MYSSLYHLFVCLSTVICGNMYFCFIETMAIEEEKRIGKGSRVMLREQNNMGSSSHCGFRTRDILQSDGRYSELDGYK